MMLAAAVCFSLGGLLIKLVPWSPYAINGVRNLIAACVIGSFILLTHHRIKWNFTVMVGAVCMAGVTTLFSIANKMTTAGNAIVLQYSAPIWIILLMFLFFHKKPTRMEVVTIGLVLIGILCFFLDSLSAGRIVGDLIALISGLFYAGVFMLNQFEKGDALSSMFFGQLLCGQIHNVDKMFQFSLLLFSSLLNSSRVSPSDRSIYPSLRATSMTLSKFVRQASFIPAFSKATLLFSRP